MVNLKDKVKKLTVIYICFFAICALFYFVAGDQIQTKRSVSPQIVPDGIVGELIDGVTIDQEFLCNQKKTSFFLLVMPEEKAFDTSAFSKKLGVSHMSFASPELMWEHLGTRPGSASVVGLLNDEDDYVQLILDKEVAESEYFVCNTGINTTHLKIRTQDLIKKFLPYTHHRPRIVDL